MEKVFCIKTMRSSVSILESGKWYLGDEYDGRMYRIFGEGKSTSSELVIPKLLLEFKVSGNNVYDEHYIGMFKKEYFITQSEWRDRIIDQII